MWPAGSVKSDRPFPFLASRTSGGQSLRHEVRWWAQLFGEQQELDTLGGRAGGMKRRGSGARRPGAAATREPVPFSRPGNRTFNVSFGAEPANPVGVSDLETRLCSGIELQSNIHVLVRSNKYFERSPCLCPGWVGRPSATCWLHLKLEAPALGRVRMYMYCTYVLTCWM